jgi:hypothetical protein
MMATHQVDLSVIYYKKIQMLLNIRIMIQAIQKRKNIYITCQPEKKYKSSNKILQVGLYNNNTNQNETRLES